MAETLLQLQVGEKARVVAFKDGPQYYRQRLLALGLVPGAEFTVSRAAPLGDPIELKLASGLSLSIRRHEGQILAIEKAS